MNKPSSPKTADDFQWVDYCYSIIYVIKNSNGGVSFTRREIINMVLNELKISEDLLKDRVKHNTTPKIVNRIEWAVSFLHKLEYLSASRENSTYNKYSLTQKSQPSIDEKELTKTINNLHKEYQREYNKNKSANKKVPISKQEEEENLENIEDLSWKTQMINQLYQLSPTMFEKFCGALLRNMDFQGVNVTQQTRDGGIDINAYALINSVIREKVIIQCKRYANDSKIGTEDLHKFLGAMSLSNNCKKGIFITLSDFKTSVKSEEFEMIELVNGDRLCDLISKYYPQIVNPIISYELNDKFKELFPKDGYDGK